jgi:hypothetical protein
MLLVLLLSILLVFKKMVTTSPATANTPVIIDNSNGETSVALGAGKPCFSRIAHHATTL